MLSFTLLGERVWKARERMVSRPLFVSGAYLPAGGEDFLAEGKGVEEAMGGLCFIKSDHLRGQIQFFRGGSVEMG